MFKHVDPLMVSLHFEKDSEISRTTMTSSNQSFHNQSIIQEDVRRDSKYRIVQLALILNKSHQLKFSDNSPKFENN
jgi:hypothetical protein